MQDWSSAIISLLQDSYWVDASTLAVPVIYQGRVRYLLITYQTACQLIQFIGNMIIREAEQEMLLSPIHQVSLLDRQIKSYYCTMSNMRKEVMDIRVSLAHANTRRPKKVELTVSPLVAMELVHHYELHGISPKLLEELGAQWTLFSLISEMLWLETEDDEEQISLALDPKTFVHSLHMALSWSWEESS